MPKVLLVKIIVHDDYDVLSACEDIDTALGNFAGNTFDLEYVECEDIIYENV